VQIAGKTTSYRDGEKYIETEHSDFKVAATIDARLFEKPE